MSNDSSEHFVVLNHLADECAERYAASADGREIVAHSEALEQLEDRIATAGADRQRVVREWITGPKDDNVLGGGEYPGTET
jgi:hypothetical protein